MYCRLVDEVAGSINQLNELGGDHEFVSTKTNTLHQSCEHLLEEQTSLMNVAEAIQSKLSYFNELDRINSVCILLRVIVADIAGWNETRTNMLTIFFNVNSVFLK